MVWTKIEVKRGELSLFRLPLFPTTLLTGKIGVGFSTCKLWQKRRFVNEGFWWVSGERERFLTFVSISSTNIASEITIIPLFILLFSLFIIELTILSFIWWWLTNLSFFPLNSLLFFFEVFSHNSPLAFRRTPVRFFYCANIFIYFSTLFT